MPRRRSFRRRGGFRRARSFIRKTVVNMGPVHVKRILFDKESIPDITSTAYDNPLTITMLVGAEGVDEEKVTNGSDIAETRIYSKVVGFKGKFFIRSPGTDTLTLRWMLYKSPDDDISLTDLGDTNFHSSADTTNSRELRANILAKGQVLCNKSSSVERFPLFIRRSTLRRLGNFKEGDKIKLAIAADVAVTTQATLSGFGAFYVRE